MKIIFTSLIIVGLVLCTFSYSMECNRIPNSDAPDANEEAGRIFYWQAKYCGPYYTLSGQHNWERILKEMYP